MALRRRKTMLISRLAVLLSMCVVSSYPTSVVAAAEQEKSVQLTNQAGSAKPSSSVPEVSTEELEQIIKHQSAMVLDTRPGRDRTAY
jgi:hypothetical protein